MRNDFLPIPDAPNYEINSQLICRNRKTKRKLKLFVVPNRHSYYSMRPPGWKHTLKRSPQHLRAQAVNATHNHTYEPIPSLDYRYEIDERGNVRNTATKHVIAPKDNGKCVAVRDSNRKYICVCIADLLWEVHGRIIKRRFRPCPCSAENNHGKHFFQNMAECARFLAPKVFLGVKTLKGYLGKRKSTIGEWKITYINERLDDVKWNSRSFGTIAHHQAKLDAQGGLS